MATFVYLVRHGETHWNKRKWIQGHTDTAAAVAAWLPTASSEDILAATDRDGPSGGVAPSDDAPFVAVYSSDLQRTMATATPLAGALGLEVETDARLREHNLGVFEGYSWLELIDNPVTDAQVVAYRASPDNRIPYGESANDKLERVAAALQDIVARHPGKKVVVVVHGGVMSAVYYYLTGAPVPGGGVRNASIAVLRVDGSPSGGGGASADAAPAAAAAPVAMAERSDVAIHGLGTVAASHRAPASWSWYAWGIVKHLKTAAAPTPLLPATPAARAAALGDFAEDELLASFFAVKHTTGCQAAASVVFPNLVYLSGADWVKEHYTELTGMGITHVINAAGSEIGASTLPDGTTVPYPRDAFAAAGVALLEHDWDDTDSFVEGHPALLTELEACVAWMQAAHTKGGRVLVHCSAGQSRSATVVIAFAMAHSRRSLYRCLAYVRGKRKFAYPGPAFLAVLAQFEAKVLGSVSVPAGLRALHLNSSDSLWRLGADPVLGLAEALGVDPGDPSERARLQAALDRNDNDSSAAIVELLA